ncbi:MAG: nitrogen fixation protein NifZ [Methylococcales bacterium]|nr:nitrogen fixation protein NifZ [Methylococcales bacterium]
MNPDRYDEGRFEFGETVRVTRNVRNDGTYPEMDVGILLVRRGSVGNILNVGTFLQDQVIYTVHFLNVDRMVGCRLEELIGGDEPWNPSRFEFRDKVVCNIDLGVQGNILFPKGTEGEVFKVIRDSEKIQYHVAFHGRTLQVPEPALDPAHPGSFNEPEN